MARASRWLVGVPDRLDPRACCGCSASATSASAPSSPRRRSSTWSRRARQQGVLDQTEVDLIHSVFEFTETPVARSWCRGPRSSPSTRTRRRTRSGALIVESGFSRIPAYEGSIDNVVGLVYVKDALRLLEKRQPVVLRKILHPVHFVPETKKVGRAAEGAAEAAHPHGAGDRRARLGHRPRDPRGPARGDRRRDPGRVRLGGAPGRAAAGRLAGGRGHGLGGRAARELRDPDPGVRGVRDRGRLHAGRARLACPRAARSCQSGDYRLTVVDVERNRISKVKIEKLPRSGPDVQSARARRPVSGSAAVRSRLGGRSSGRRGSALAVRMGSTRGGSSGRRRRQAAGGRRHLEEERRGLAPDAGTSAGPPRSMSVPPDHVRRQGHHDVGLRRPRPCCGRRAGPGRGCSARPGRPVRSAARCRG